LPRRDREQPRKTRFTPRHHYHIERYNALFIAWLLVKSKPFRRRRRPLTKKPDKSAIYCKNLFWFIRLKDTLDWGSAPDPAGGGLSRALPQTPPAPGLSPWTPKKVPVTPPTTRLSAQTVGGGSDSGGLAGRAGGIPYFRRADLQELARVWSSGASRRGSVFPANGCHAGIHLRPERHGPRRRWTTYAERISSLSPGLA